jgi:hypothetical protein
MGGVASWLMQFLTSGEIGKALTNVLRNAESVRVASAFFSPGSETSLYSS